MTRYFFATFIALVTLVLNYAAFLGGLSGSALITSILAVNLFSLSLILFWIGGYSTETSRARYFIFGHATLFLSAGTGIFTAGLHSIVSESCVFLTRDEYSKNFIYRFTYWVAENSYCPWLGAGFMAFGVFMAWPSLKLFVGIQTKKP